MESRKGWKRYFKIRLSIAVSLSRKRSCICLLSNQWEIIFLHYQWQNNCLFQIMIYFPNLSENESNGVMRLMGCFRSSLKPPQRVSYNSFIREWINFGFNLIVHQKSTPLWIHDHLDMWRASQNWQKERFLALEVDSGLEG